MSVINLPTTPIGVFDSGVGGLSVLREIRRAMPSEDLLYVADSGHAPYGDRPSDYIHDRSKAVAEYLVGQGVKAIVIACNTATVVAVEELRSWCPVPVVAMEPAIKPAVGITRSGVVGVLATSQTLASPSVARLCNEYGSAARILLQACPGLVEQVERAELDNAATRALLNEYLSPLMARGADTLVLGCSHYAFLHDAIRAVVGGEVTIIDPSGAVARELVRRVGAAGGAADVPEAGAEPARAGEDRFVSSGDLAQASLVISRLWGRKVEVAAL